MANALKNLQAGLVIEEVIRDILDPLMLQAEVTGEVTSIENALGLDLGLLDSQLEKAILELETLDHQLEVDAQLSAKNSQAAETQYRRDLQALERELAGVFELAESMEDRYQQVGWSAVRVGKQLASTEAQRQRTIEASQLLASFIVFEAAAASTEHVDAAARKALADLRALHVEQEAGPLSEAELLRQNSARLHQLHNMTQQGSHGRLQATTDVVQRACDLTETEVLDRFEEAYARLDALHAEAEAKGAGGAARAEQWSDGMWACVLQMRSSAETLEYFNGARAIQKRVIFRVLQQMHSKAHDKGGSESINDLSRLVDAIASTCRFVFDVIGQVFPMHKVDVVVRALVERLINDETMGFAAGAAALLEPLHASDDPKLFLEQLSLVQQTSLALLRFLNNMALHAAPEDKPSSPSPSVGTRAVGLKQQRRPRRCPGEAVWSAVAAVGADAHGATPMRRVDRDDWTAVDVGLVMPQLLHGYKVGYAAREAENLRRRFASALTAAAGADAVTTDSSQWGVSSRLIGADGKAVASVRLDPDAAKSFDQLLDGALAESTIEAFVSAARVAFDRCRLIMAQEAGGEPREQCMAMATMFSSLSLFVSNGVLVPAVSNSAQLLKAHSSPPEEFYVVLARVHETTTKIKDLFDQVVVPFVASFPTVRTVASESRYAAMAQLEQVGVAALQVAVAHSLAQVEKLLKQQPKSDWCPKDAALADGPSETITEVVGVLSQQRLYMKSHLSAPTLGPLLTLLGMRVRFLVLEQLKRQKISMTGAMQLTRDVDMLRDTVRSFGAFEGAGAVDAAFEKLRELVVLFVLAPDQLLEVVDRGIAKDTPRTELIELVKCRADFKKKAQWVKEFFPELAAADTIYANAAQAANVATWTGKRTGGAVSSMLRTRLW